MALRDALRRFGRAADPDPYAGRLLPRGPGHAGFPGEPTAEEVRYERALRERRSWPLLNRILNIVPRDRRPPPDG